MSRRWCVRCIEDFAAPDSLVCEMCQHETDRSPATTATPVMRIVEHPKRLRRPTLAHFLKFIKMVGSAA